MKKITLFLILCLAVVLCACGSEAPAAESDPTVAPVATPAAAAAPEPTATPEPIPTHEPGPYFDGYDLHYADENGLDVISASVGVLDFDENGVYTSGNAELDALVREKLEANVNPAEQSRFEMLETMYDHMVAGYGYRGGAYHEEGETGWEAEDALTMIKAGKGNCYSYAALFAEYARALGYQANGVAGVFSSGEHSWTEVLDETDGEYRVCDSEFQACFDWNNNYFYLTYEDGNGNGYRNPHV